MIHYSWKRVLILSEQRENIRKAAARLRLSVFAQYEKYTDPKHSFEENLNALLREQSLIADQERFKRRIRYAGFPQVKTFDTFVMSDEHLPNLNFDELRSLKDCAFIDEKSNVVALGPAGRGKTHAALAVGYEAVKHGYSVRFKRACDMVNEMAEAQSEKRLTEYIKSINRCQLLIIDEVGYLEYDAKAANLLFQVVGARAEIASTFYTTNLPFSEWTQFIKDERLALAIIGRIAHQAVILNMNGPKDWRLESTRSRQQRVKDN
jgi:DNA replication protein DnaC